MYSKLKVKEMFEMKRHKRITNQKGFTLIEIIAVLVILAIMAAVAIPKYLNMQAQAGINAAQGALAAGASNVTQTYANLLLSGTANVTSNMVANNCSTNLGDWSATYTANATNNISVDIVVNSTVVTGVPSTNRTKTVILVP